MKRLLYIITIILFLSYTSTAYSYEIRGELSTWLSYIDNVSHDYLVGMRYLPELTVLHPLSHSTVDFMASANINFEVPSHEFTINKDTSDADFYRLWGRWSTSQLEVRGGLQKINFGPAKILRSLMWFDTIDPRDPFGLTEGVKGMLFRYYSLENSTLWLWGLYGNDDIKGLETVATDESRPEWGGRYQFPLEKGEMALSYHHRKTGKSIWYDDGVLLLDKAIEDRIALDVFRDVGVGLWLEAVAGRSSLEKGFSLWSEYLTVGIDYTFDGGIHILGEHFIVATGPDWDETASMSSVSALSADYSINIFDRINTIVTYDWFTYKRQGFLGWQRSYDDWRINLLGFSGPRGGAGKFNGDGFQMILTYNH